MRIIIIAGAILMVAGCSDSAETPQIPQMSEETAAAELMHGLLDRASLSQRWIEQTSTSPAVFKITMVGQNDTSVFTASITKADKCKYQSKFDFPGVAGGPSDFEMTSDLTGLDPTKLEPGSRPDARKFVGASLSCHSDADACKKFEEGDVPAVMPVPKARFLQLATEFKAKYCS